MHAWRAREARIAISGEKPQWCLDNGEGDLIPCGPDESGKQRAEDLAITLNLGSAAKAKAAAVNVHENDIIKAAKEIYERTQAIDILIQQAGLTRKGVNLQIDTIVSKLGELQLCSVELQKALFG
jgi:hypothetical protein